MATTVMGTVTACLVLVWVWHDSLLQKVQVTTSAMLQWLTVLVPNTTFKKSYCHLCFATTVPAMH